MRLLRLLVAVAFVAMGAIVGALNRQATIVDAGFALIPTTLGVALLTTLLLGVALGGLAGLMVNEFGYGDAAGIQLYLQESLTFLAYTAEASVPLTAG